ncbi:MAG: fibronectin type III domain-containing protein [Thermoplasmata archaeon]
MAASLLFTGIFGGLTLVTSQTANHGLSGPTGGFSFDTIGVNSGYTIKACSLVTTCSTTVAVAAYSALLIGVTQYSTTAPSAVAVHGYTPTDLEATANVAPVSYIYGIQSATAKTVTVYVNYSAASYYVIGLADMTNVVTTATYDSGVGTASGNSNSATCALTTTAPKEAIFALIGVLGTESSITPGSGMSQLDMAATITNIVTQENQEGIDTATGSYTASASLNSQNTWRTDCVGLLPASVPPVPTSLTSGTVTTTSVPLTWTNPAGPITGATVYWASFSGSCGAYSSSASASSPFTSYTVTALVSGNSYCFEVTVSNSTGTSADSTPLTNVRTASVPSAPTSVSAIPQPNSTTQLDVFWTVGIGTVLNQSLARTGTTAGACNAFTVGGGAVFTNIVDPTASEWVVTGLAAGTTYCFEVQGWNSTGEGAWSAAIEGTTYAVPSAPSGLSATGVTSSSVALAWVNPSGNLVNDTILVGTTCGTWTVQISLGIASAGSSFGLSPYVTYCFAVQAWSAGSFSAVSSTLKVTTLAGIPGTPSALVSTGAAATSVSLSWVDPSPNTGSFTNTTVYWGATCGSSVTGANGNPGTWASNVGTNSLATVFTVTGLSPNAVYCFSVTVWTQGGQGGQAIAIDASTLNAAPSAPTGLTYVSASRTAVTLTWVQPAGVLVNNTLAYSTTASCGGTLTTLSTGGPTINFTAGSLATGTTYYWEVSAWTNGGESPYSSCVTGATQGAIPPAPYDLADQLVGTTYAYLTWTNPIGYSLTDNIVYVSNAGGPCGTWSQTDDLGMVAASAEVTGLTAASTYCIEVTAVDAQSNYSAPLYVATPSNPSGGAALSQGSSMGMMILVISIGVGSIFALTAWRRRSASPRQFESDAPRDTASDMGPATYRIPPK